MKNFQDEILSIAHRGASGYAPENTMVAFERAVELGADGIECDVQLTKDGHVIILHDETLKRTTNGKGDVADHSLAEIRQLDAGSWFASEYAGERIPTLQDLLGFAKGKILLNIEIKSTPNPKQLVEKVSDLIINFGMVDQCLITSFDVQAVQWAALMLSDCPRGLLTKKITKDIWQGTWNFIAAKSNLVSPAMMKDLEFYKKSLLVWTVNEETEMELLYKNGARRIITNVPDRYQKVIEKIKKNIDC